MSDIVEQCAAVWDRKALEAELAQASAKIVEQAAEIERLRAALRDIHASAKDNHLIANIARAALEGK